jgi:hypothetical protein
MQHNLHANDHPVAEPRAKATEPAGYTHQRTAWLKECRREGVYFAGQKTSERQGALLQELDETLTRFEGGRHG